MRTLGEQLSFLGKQARTGAPMKNLTASILLAVSVLADGFWRAGNKLHHFFGAILVGLVVVFVFPAAIIKRAMGKKGHRNDRKSE